LILTVKTLAYELKRECQYVEMLKKLKGLTAAPPLDCTKPLKKPVPLDGAHGVSNCPSVAECPPGKNWNSTLFPTATLTEFGLNVRPLWPTAIVWTELDPLEVELAALELLLAVVVPPPP
jgi:hypothetical protein